MAGVLCNGRMRVWKKEPKSPGYQPGLDWPGNIRPTGVKRIRLVCPVCKRRVLSSVHMAHDNDEIIHSLPPHKPKRWWTKGRERKQRKKAGETIKRRVG